MKFRFSENLVIDSDAEPFCREGLRIANFGGPGSGKSFNNALMVEQFLLQGGTVVIFQPRDEYFTLKEKFDILSVGGVHAKDVDFALTSPSTYAKAVVENGISMVFYTSDVEDEAKLVDWVERFLHALMKLQETHHRPLMILPEESQEYLPNSTAGHIAPPWVYNRMIKAFKDCSTQGRKLNIIPVVSSQRPQEVNFTIRQLCNVTFYGKFAAHDTKYLDKEVLDTVRKNGVEIKAEQLTRFGLGEWFVVLGSKSMFVTVTEKRLTKHGADTPSLEYVAPRPSEVKQTIDELAKTLAAALEAERTEESDLEKTKRQLRETQKKLEEAEKNGQIKLAVKEMIEGSAPASVNASVDKEAFEAERKGRLDAEKELVEAKKRGNEIMQEIAEKYVHRDLVKKEVEEAREEADLNGYSRGRADAEMELQQKIDALNGELEQYRILAPLKAMFGELIKAATKEHAEIFTEAMVSSSVADVKVAEEFNKRLKAVEEAVKNRPLQDGAGSVVSVTEIIPTFEVKTAFPVVSQDESTRDGQLMLMAAHSYFNEKRRLIDIGKELDRCYVFPSRNLGRDLSPVLEKLVQNKVLQREEASNGGWLYSLFDGAKDRIKEAA